MARPTALWGAVQGRVDGPVDTLAVDLSEFPGDPAVRLAVFGDVGTGDSAEWETAQLAVEASASDPFDALVLLGDNVYPDGDPERLDATVFDPFGEILEQGTALLPVLGNHDVRDGNAKGQVERLGMPGRWYSTEIGPLMIIALDSTLVDDSDQLAWLESTLAASDADWTVVALHHPPYSAGYHGSTRSVHREWVPLFEEHGVDLVFSGHDHDYQRTHPINGITYIVTGAAAKTRPTDQASFTAYAASVLHWVEVAVRDDRIDILASTIDGPIDSVTIDATTAASSISPGIGLEANRNPARFAFGVGTLGAVVWFISLLIGWYGPPSVADHNHRALTTGTTAGSLATIIGFAAATVFLVL